MFIDDVCHSYPDMNFPPLNIPVFQTAFVLKSPPLNTPSSHVAVCDAVCIMSDPNIPELKIPLFQIILL
jgi:hypothetical protein